MIAVFQETLFINGIFVRKKLGGLEDYGAVYMPPEAVGSLHPGKNIIEIRTLSSPPGGDLKISAGIIDWR